VTKKPDLSHAIEHLEGVIECDRVDGCDSEAPGRVESYGAAVAILRDPDAGAHATIVKRLRERLEQEEHAYERAQRGARRGNVGWNHDYLARALRSILAAGDEVSRAG
jgi:hypothetical protein